MKTVNSLIKTMEMVPMTCIRRVEMKKPIQLFARLILFLLRWPEKAIPTGTNHSLAYAGNYNALTAGLEELFVIFFLLINILN